MSLEAFQWTIPMAESTSNDSWKSPDTVVRLFRETRRDSSCSNYLLLQRDDYGRRTVRRRTARKRSFTVRMSSLERNDERRSYVLLFIPATFTLTYKYTYTIE